MAARSPPSPHPPTPARQLGPRSPRVGRGAEVHAVRSEASGLAGAAREVVADKSDIIWLGEEGSGGRQGPRGAAPPHAPLLSAPMGSRRLEGISVEEAMVTRTQLLEEELNSLKEELALCQVSRILAAGLSPTQRDRDPWGGAPFSLCLGTYPAPPSDAPSRFHTRLRPRPGSGGTRLRPPTRPRARAPFRTAARQASPPSPDLVLAAWIHSAASPPLSPKPKFLADKEFVWSLWKRLQVTNPDLTQVVSLVVER
ncbi:Centlein [Plecturocebus cupreus]